MVRQQAQQGGKDFLLNERFSPGQYQAAAWITERQFRRLFRREPHSGNCPVPGVRRVTPGTGQVAVCQAQKDAGSPLGDAFPLDGMENFRLSVKLGQCEHDQAGLRLPYPCRPSTPPCGGCRKSGKRDAGAFLHSVPSSFQEHAQPLLRRKAPTVNRRRMNPTTEAAPVNSFWKEAWSFSSFSSFFTSSLEDLRISARASS